MKKELIQTLTATFEAHAQQTEAGTEYWLARDLQFLLGYAEWRNFNNTAVSKARIACELSAHAVSDHFVGVNKMVDLGSGSRREVDDLMLTGETGYSGPTRLVRRRTVDARVNKHYRASHIRPMAVRPLDHPERWPTPWGFLFCDAGFASGQLQ